MTLSKRVVVASNNPVKIEAARRAFEAMFKDQPFTFEGVSVPSGVSIQPMTDAETLQGAQNRAGQAAALVPDAHFWVGIEGGIEDTPQAMHAFAWMAVHSPRRTSHARTATFTLPESVATLVRQGVELGVADDMVFGRENSKQSNGAVGLLTHDVIDRAAYYEHALILALIPFFREDLY